VGVVEMIRVVDGLLTFYKQSHTVAAGAYVIFSFFYKSLNEFNVVGTAGSGLGPSGEGYFWCRPSAIARM